MNLSVLLSFAVLAGLAVLGEAQRKQVKFINCKASGGSGKPSAVFVDPCAAEPCILNKGKNSTITITFTPDATTTSVTSQVHGVIAGIPVPYPITGKDGCKDSGLTCPLKSGVSVTFHKAIYVSSAYPSLKLLVKWELQDQNNKDLVCIEIPVKVA